MDTGGYLEGWLMRWRGYHLREGKQQDVGASKIRPKQTRSIWTKIFVSQKARKREKNSRDRSEVSLKEKKGNAVDPEAVSDSLN